MKRSSNACYFWGVITQPFVPMKRCAYIGLGKGATTMSCVQQQCNGRIGDLRGTFRRNEPLFDYTPIDAESVTNGKGVISAEYHAYHTL